METIVRNLFWNGTDCHPHRHLVSWDRVSLPKNYGGLGLGAFKHRNNALPQKWLWQFTQEDNPLWKRVITSIYGIEDHVWLPSPPKLSSRGRPWVAIDQQRLFFIRFISFKAKNGSKIKVWKDTWLGNNPLEFKFPDLFCISNKKDCMVAECWNTEQGDRNLGF